MRILLAEDEKDLNRIITRKLTSDGYSVDSCFNGKEAIDYLQAAEYDAVILDIMMPQIDGFGVLSYLRNNGKSVPVLFLTAKDSVADRVKGLDSGADDYLVKPFSFEELAARLRAMTRKNFGMTDNILKVADLTLDTASHTVRRGEREISLSAKEYSLLEYLMRNRGIVLSREKIENHIWNFDYEGGTNVVDVYISYLRKKIDGGRSDKLIHTVRGSGYVLKEKK
ncbi:response regulator transcription factor [Ruminococcus sp. Marseille-P6503]|uniref:response regulator transcription factor n=1 Tax=Ruminococcus sp. Marseille-P6503 TaxID=2364796 RepID=UPI000F52D57C|nr:response regulator transcription factor [Ruminococcus sp. Marseille-P6503]